MENVAPSTHLEMLAPGQIRTVVTCVARVLADSERTGDIMVAEELTAQAQLRHLLSTGIFDARGTRSLLADRPNLANADFDALAALPAHTLGGALARFHSDNGLSRDIYDVPAQYTDDPDAAYLMERMRHSHDIWHVLTGLGIAGHEEILLHAFSLAQTGMPSSIALMALGGLKHMLFEGRFRMLAFGMREAYAAGRAAERLLPIRWEDHWETPVTELRQRYGITPLTDIH